VLVTLTDDRENVISREHCGYERADCACPVGFAAPEAVAHCPDCGAVGMDNCERVTCRWDQWDDGTRVTEKQRSDGAKFADAVNAYLAKRSVTSGQ
jgi:hypothetical protein